MHEDLDFDLKSGLLKNSNRDYRWCVHSKCHWNCICFFSLKTTYIVMNCHWLLIIWDILITYFMQKTWEVVFYNYWLDLIRVTYLFYNCLVLRSIFREIRNHFYLWKKKSVGLFRWTKSLGTYYFFKKEFLIPYYHNKAE